MRRLIMLGFLAAAAAAFGQDAPTDDFSALAGSAATPSPAASSGGPTLKWSGTHELSDRLGVYDPSAHTGWFLNSTMSAEGRWDDWKLVAGAAVRDDEFVPEETALYWSPGTLKFGAGWQIFSWGVADKVNPTDTLNARDYRYRVDAPRLANPAASASWYPFPWMSVEAVYEPWKEESKYPTDFAAQTQAGLDANASRLEAQLTSVGGTSAALASQLAATYHPQASTSGLARNGSQPVWAGRLNLYFPSVDLSFSYVDDWDSFYTPTVTMTNSGGLWLPASVLLEYDRVQRLGLNAKTTVGGVGLWIEAAYNITGASSSAVDSRHNSLAWTTGFDVNYGPESAFYANVQYAGVWVDGYDDSTIAASQAALTLSQLTNQSFMSALTYAGLTQSLGDQTERVLHSLTVNLQWPLYRATFTPSLTGVVAVPQGYDSTLATRWVSTSLEPDVEWVFADAIHVHLGADLAYAWIVKTGASSASLDTSVDRLGLYTTQNALYLKVVYEWSASSPNSATKG